MTDKICSCGVSKACHLMQHNCWNNTGSDCKTLKGGGQFGFERGQEPSLHVPEFM